MRRYFTLEQAENLLKIVGPLLEQAVYVFRTLAETGAQLALIGQRVAALGGAMVDRQQVASLRNREKALRERLDELIGEIQSHGCQVKDLRLGLLDFPTRYKDREVLLCWRLGEPAIDYWHEVDAGFAGRRRIDEEFLRNHSGDPEN